MNVYIFGKDKTSIVKQRLVKGTISTLGVEPPIKLLSRFLLYQLKRRV